MDPEAGQASRKLTAELLRADKWRVQKTGESIFPRMRALRNYFSQHCSPPPPPLLFFFLFFFFILFFFLSSRRVSKNRKSRFTTYVTERDFYLHVYYFSRPRFHKHIVPFKHNRERKSSFSVFPPSFPIFSLSLFFSLTDARQFPSRVFSRQVFKFCAIAKQSLD